MKGILTHADNPPPTRAVGAHLRERRYRGPGDIDKSAAILGPEYGR